MEDLNNIVYQLYLTIEFFSSSRETFRIDHILGHKTTLNIFKVLNSFEICSPTTMECNWTLKIEEI